MELFKLFGTIMIDNDKANKSLQKTDQQAQSSGTKMVNTFKKVATAVGAYLSVKAIKDFGKACIDAYEVQKQAELKLETIMKQRMKASDSSIQSVKDLASEQQRLGVVGDELQLSGAQQLATFLDNDKALKTLIPAMNNLAVQQNGVNVSADKMVNIGNLMGKVMQGQTGALKKVGITFTESQEKVLKYGNEQERAAMLAQVIADNVGNMNEEFAKTDSGKIQQAKNKFGDLQEKIGGYLMPVLGTLAGWFNSFVMFISNNLDPALSGIGAIFNTIGEIFGINQENISLLWETYGKPVFDRFLEIIATLKQSWDIIFPAIMDLWSSFWDTLRVLWDSIGQPIFEMIMYIVDEVIKFFQNNMPQISKIVSDVFQTIGRWWREVLQPIFQAIGSFLQNFLIPAFKTAFDFAKNHVQWAFNTISSLWNNSLKPILNGIISFLNGIFTGNWKNVWNGIISVLKGLWGGLKTILYAPIDWLLTRIKGIGDAIARPFRSAVSAIGDIWKAVKSLFKLPHFAFHGSYNPVDWIMDGDLPSISVDWYKNGGIMTRPTMFDFDMANMKAKIGGEAGPEAVAPLSKLEDYYKKWSSDLLEKQNPVNINIENMEVREEQDIEKIAKQLYFMLSR